MFHNNYQYGSVPIYVALLTVAIVTSSSLALSALLARQIQNTENIIESERAYYAATSGAEEALWVLVQNLIEGVPNGPLEPIEGVVPYDNDIEATYTVGDAQLRPSDDGLRALPCVDSEGEYSGNQRRLVLDQVSVDCEF
ncbi:MAG: hypothetical protein WEC84_01875 [Candidatus Andersenbacteria bacterium]